MAFSTSPNFATAPRSLSVIAVSAANLHDPAGTIVNLITGATAGTKVNEIRAAINFNGLSGYSTVCIWISNDSGVTWRLFDELLLASATSSSAVATTKSGPVYYQNLVLYGTTDRLGASTTVAQSTSVVAMAVDLVP